MGMYLTKPRTEKESENGGNEQATFGLTAMQGWRHTMEDAHLACTDFDPELCDNADYTVFGVFDGHGGAAVSKWVAQHFREIFKSQLHTSWRDLEEGRKKPKLSELPVNVASVCEALQTTFLELDEQMQTKEAREELKSIKAVGRANTGGGNEGFMQTLLNTSSVEPYFRIVTHDGQRFFQLLKPEEDSSFDEEYEPLANEFCSSDEEDAENSNEGGAEEEEEEDDGSSSADESPPENEDSTDGKPASSRGVGRPRGKNRKGKAVGKHTDAETSEARIKEIKEHEKDSKEDGALVEKRLKTQHVVSEGLDNTHMKGTDAVLEGEIPGMSPNETGTENAAATAKTETDLVGEKSLEKTISETAETIKKDSLANDTLGKTAAAEEPFIAGPADAAGEKTFTREEEDQPLLGEKEGKIKAKKPNDDLNERKAGSDDSSSDDAEKKDTGNEGEVAEESDDENAYKIAEYCGTTAIVVVLIGGDHPMLVTANAGDSRAVLCRDGEAISLSKDHKPDLSFERNRIYKAGGMVEYGRVDGNLNLSRSIGDLMYKKNKELSPESQKITAYPDVRVTPILADDEFAVLACDGIWDCKSNQEVVDFVRERLPKPDERPATNQQLSAICEELCDQCIAPDSWNSSGGIGCDNMTVVIVQLAPRLREMARAKNAAASPEVSFYGEDPYQNDDEETN